MDYYGQEKRKKIIESAISQYVKHGFDGAGMSAIAEEAGIAKGTIYLYFANKEHLKEQVFWYCHRLDVEACQVGLEECSCSLEKLCRRAENAIRWAIRNPGESQIERMYFSSAHPGNHSRYSCQYLHFDAVEAIVAEGLFKKELKDLPSPLLGEMFYGIAGAVLNYVEAYPELVDNKDFWLKCRESIVNCLQA